MCYCIAHITAVLIRKRIARNLVRRIHGVFPSCDGTVIEFRELLHVVTHADTQVIVKLMMIMPSEITSQCTDLYGEAKVFSSAKVENKLKSAHTSSHASNQVRFLLSHIYYA